ncbi:unnamed protein product [Allacma fusca]|uniref:Uncharacterized protein n=1 Tax=Allacma fusca TaxID=39272 RepID=A0A8J2P255_9HEXA|nr:unnamed protein product [Allacma fusca]
MLKLLEQDITSAPNGILEDCNIYQDVYLLAMDATARCTVNVKITDPRSPDNDFSKALREFFPATPNLVMILFNLFPQLSGLTRPFAGKPSEGFFSQIFQRQEMEL